MFAVPYNSPFVSVYSQHNMVVKVASMAEEEILG